MSRANWAWVSSASKTAQQIVPVASPQKLHQVLGHGFLDEQNTEQMSSFNIGERKGADEAGWF